MFYRILILLGFMTVLFHVYLLLEDGQFAENTEPVLMDADRKDEIPNLLLDTLIFIQRKEHMNEMCRIYRHLHRNIFEDGRDFDHILVDEKRKLLYCYVPKVGCTNWKRVFMVLLGMADPQNASSIPADVVHKKTVFPRLSDFSVDQVRFFITNYTKYLFVRHPFERLLSAYKNKLEVKSNKSKYFQMRIGREIIRHYRIQAENRSLQYGDDVTFEEFASYLTDHQVTRYNEHWKPISELCYPCLLKYDFIGKYETLYSDSEFLLKAINESRIKFPRVRLSNVPSQIKKYFNYLPATLIARLYNIFILDFKLFNYSTENILGYEIG